MSSQTSPETAVSSPIVDDRNLRQLHQQIADAERRVQKLVHNLQLYQDSLSAVSQARKRVAADTIELLSETSSWSMSIMFSHIADAFSVALSSQESEIATRVQQPLVDFLAHLNQLKLKLDERQELYYAYKKLRDLQTSDAKVALECRDAKERFIEFDNLVKQEFDELNPRIQSASETALRTLIDCEQDQVNDYKSVLEGWTTAAGRLGNEPAVGSDMDTVLHFASNVWLYLSNLNQDLLRTDMASSRSPHHSRTNSKTHHRSSSATLITTSPSRFSNLIPSIAEEPSEKASLGDNNNGQTSAKNEETSSQSMEDMSLGKPMIDNDSGLGDSESSAQSQQDTTEISPGALLQRYKDCFGRHPISSLAIPVGFEILPQTARYALKHCCSQDELEALLHYHRLTADSLERIRRRDLADCHFTLDGKIFRSADDKQEIVNVQAKETAIRSVLQARNPRLASWHPGRVRSFADLISQYVSGAHAAFSSRIAVQLLFGRKGVVDIVPSMDKADLQRPTDLQITSQLVSITVPLTWWVIEAQGGDRKNHRRLDSVEEDQEPTDSKYSVLGIVDTDYSLKIKIDDFLNHDRPQIATVFIKRRNAVPTSPKKDRNLRLWMDRSGSFRVEAEFKGMNDGKVHLLKQNGVKVAVPLEILCKADLYHINYMTGLDVSHLLDADDTKFDFDAWRVAMPKLHKPRAVAVF